MQVLLLQIQQTCIDIINKIQLGRTHSLDQTSSVGRLTLKEHKWVFRHLMVWFCADWYLYIHKLQAGKKLGWVPLKLKRKRNLFVKLTTYSLEQWFPIYSGWNLHTFIIFIKASQSPMQKQPEHFCQQKRGNTSFLMISQQKKPAQSTCSQPKTSVQIV